MRIQLTLLPVLSLLLSLFSFLAASGCKKKVQDDALRPVVKGDGIDPEYVVAMINGNPLTWEELNRRAMGYMKDDVETNHLVIPSNRVSEAEEHFRKHAIKAFVFKTVTMEEALKQKISLSDKDRATGLEDLANNLKARNWTTNDFFHKGPLSEKEMRQEFEDGLVIDKLMRINVSTRVQVDEAEVNQALKEITATNLATKARLEGIRQEILDGADFAIMARRHSQDESAKNGGDLGEFTQGKMMKALEKAAYSQKVGEVGEVLRSSHGFHLLKVTARSEALAATDSTPAVPASVRVSHILLKALPTHRKLVMNRIMRAKVKRGMEDYYRDLLGKARIECYLYPEMQF